MPAVQADNPHLQAQVVVAVVPAVSDKFMEAHLQWEETVV
jgi:hypothetical protein